MIPIMMTHTKQMLGPDIKFNCPTCGQLEAIGKTVDVISQDKLLALIPVKNTHISYLVCTSCRTSYRTKIPSHMLSTLPIQEVTENLKDTTTFFQGSFAIIAAILCFIPFLGLVLSAIALLSQTPGKSWSKRLAVFATIISIITSIFYDFMFDLFIKIFQ